MTNDRTADLEREAYHQAMLERHGILPKGEVVPPVAAPPPVPAKNT